MQGAIGWLSSKALDPDSMAGRGFCWERGRLAGRLQREVWGDGPLEAGDLSTSTAAAKTERFEQREEDLATETRGQEQLWAKAVR